jgi:hypothetical protein
MLTDKDQAAKILCEIIDDNAPIGWERYRPIARLIACNDELMSILKNLQDEKNANR